MVIHSSAMLHGEGLHSLYIVLLIFKQGRRQEVTERVL